MRTPSNYVKTRDASTAFKSYKPSKTVQSSKEEADINVIVKRFGLTGQVPVSAKVPTYQDFDEIMDYRSALEAVMDAQKAFNALPVDVRNRFRNDPQALLEFMSDEKNLEEAIKLGLTEKKVSAIVSPVDNNTGEGNAGSNSNAGAKS